MTVSEPRSQSEPVPAGRVSALPRRLIAVGAGALVAQFHAEQDRWFLWSPVALGVGIGVYFLMQQEPGWWLVIWPMIFGFAVAWTVGSERALPFALAMAVGIAGLGMVVAKSRTEWVRAPTLDRNLGPVMVRGWVETLEQKGSGRVSALISSVWIENLAAGETPARVQLTFWRGSAPLQAGVAIQVLAKLRPPPRPVAPGAYDLSRRAWFRQIGGYGFTLSRPIILDESQTSPRSWSARARIWIGGLRATVAARAMDVAGEKGGPVAAALLTGLRGGISKADLGAIRDAGLAHLLAISGLHMALMSGSAFWIVRVLIALIPWLALRVVGKKWAAGAGIVTGFVYFFLAGGSVATERAFIMVAVALIAVMVDRPAISMRNVALAALIILLMRPENLVEAGFQMSFAAVVALTAFYEQVAYRRKGGTSDFPDTKSSLVISFIVKTLTGVLLTTLVASLATGPLAAFNFNRIAVYGLAANLLAVPLVGFMVMPLGLLALVLMPFGLDGPALSLMGWGTAALVDISATVSRWPAAAVLVPSPPAMVIPVLVLGGLWLCLWRRSWRYWGLVPMGLALWLAGQNQTPDIFVDGKGRRVAIKTSSGQLILSPDRGARYAASQWLRRAADPRKVKAATTGSAANDALVCDPRACVATLFDPQGRTYRFAYIRHAAAIFEDCQRADIVISRIRLIGRCVGPAIVIDRSDLGRTGAQAISFGRQGVKIDTVAAGIGIRPWARSSTTTLFPKQLSSHPQPRRAGS